MYFIQSSKLFVLSSNVFCSDYSTSLGCEFDTPEPKHLKFRSFCSKLFFLFFKTLSETLKLTTHYSILLFFLYTPFLEYTIKYPKCCLSRKKGNITDQQMYVCGWEHTMLASVSKYSLIHLLYNLHEVL